ncbi:MAG: hypothetical protein E6K68_04020 [Nitrospirae bacterium]|nr:MAG: hypothetical protein E6K68_04020 [Nitrospirota bacterium]
MSRPLTPPSPGRWGPVLLVLLSVTTVSACARGLPYARIDRALQDGNPAEGVAILDQAQDVYGSKSTTLYLMDKGMIQYLAGRYTDSIQSLAAAEALTEDLYTRRIHSEVEAFLTSDNALPYEGEDFEKVLVNVFLALDYVHLGKWDDALVEARKVDHKLTVLADRNQKRMTYTKDALARYLGGILYEATGDLSNAFVAYRLALEAFESYHTSYGTAVPDLVRQDLLRVSEALGLNQEHQEYRQAFPGLTWQSESATRADGELVFITNAGRAPIKRDLFIDVPFSADALTVVLATKRYDRYDTDRHRAAESILYGLTGRIVRVAIPQFVPRRSAIAYTEAVILGRDARYTARSALMEDITAIAIRDLEDRLVRTMVKAVARSAWKFALAEAVRVGVRGAIGDKDGGRVAGAIAGAMAHMIAIASEEADTRSWATLPDRIFVGRMKVPPGTYDVELRHIGAYGDVVATQVLKDITITERGTHIVSRRVLQ